MTKNDKLFAEKAIYSPSMYEIGLYPVKKDDETGIVIKDSSSNRSIVIPMKHGNIYVIKFPNKTERLRAVVLSDDPRTLKSGETFDYSITKAYFEGTPENYATIMHTPKIQDEYMVIYTGSAENTDLFVGENPILIGRDTDDDWWKCGKQSDLLGNADSWGNWDWTNYELYENVYDKLMQEFPSYISSLIIGKDQTQQYDMKAYIFAPENFEQTIFVTSGIHSEEMDGYLGLARFLDILCHEKGEHEGLHYLHTKVRLVVIPIVNIWGSQNGHTRENGAGVNLNGNFNIHSQAETINVLWLLHQYYKETAAVIDFHTSLSKTLDVYYQFSIQAPNAQMCLRVTNHVYEDLKKRGLANTPTELNYIPGKYDKDNKYLQGYIWNEMGIPTLVVEHHHHRYGPLHSAIGLELAVEYYGNFLIQTALLHLK